MSTPAELTWRQMGATGVDAPILGFAVSGPLGSEFVGDSEAALLIRDAYQGGARLFDAAPFYGRAEARLGLALHGLPRATYRLVTKAGTHWRCGRAEKDFSPASIRRSLEQRLKRLGADFVASRRGPAPKPPPFSAVRCSCPASVLLLLRPRTAATSRPIWQSPAN